MTFWPNKSTLEEIAERTAANRKRIAQAKALLASALADEQRIASDYETALSTIDADVAADMASGDGGRIGTAMLTSQMKTTALADSQAMITYLEAQHIDPL